LGFNTTWKNFVASAVSVGIIFTAAGIWFTHIADAHHRDTRITSVEGEQVDTKHILAKLTAIHESQFTEKEAERKLLERLCKTGIVKDRILCLQD
jgi:hypothetical protein